MATAPRTSLVLALGLGVGVAGLLPGQNTWLVGGDGADFPDLVTAVDDPQVVHGDRLEVRPGNYGPFTTSKALRILADPAAMLFGIQVHGIPDGRRFAVHGGQLLSFMGSGGLVIHDNPGTVHFESILQIGDVPNSVWNCSHVTFSDMALTGEARIVDAAVTLSQVELQVRSFASGGIPGPASLTAERSTVLVTASTLEGSRSQGLIGPLRSNPGPAIVLVDSRLVVDRDSGLDAGLGVLGMGLLDTPALVSTNSTVRVDPATTLSTRTGGPAVQSDRPLEVVPVPAVHAVGAGPGETFQAVLSAPATWPGVLVLGNPIPPIALGTPGVLAVPPDALVVALGPVPATGLAFQATVPPGVDGSPQVVQGAVLDPTGNLWLGNPAVVILHTP